MEGKDLVSVADLTAEDVEQLLRQALELKKEADLSALLHGKSIALLFEKPSLRTRVSFDVAMWQLGGHAIYLSPAEVGLGAREEAPDVAKVLSRYVDGIVARTFSHSTVELLARYATIPVINGLSDEEHPCQALGDFLTIYEKKGAWKGLTLAFVGDGNNVANSLLYMAAMLGTHFRIASPKGYEIKSPRRIIAQEMASRRGAKLLFTHDPKEAVAGADIVYTDVWTSMGQEEEKEKRREDFASYQVDGELLALAKPDAIFMHPLPAHHGEEIAMGILDYPQSVVYLQAENRLHAQKAVLLELLAPKDSHS